MAGQVKERRGLGRAAEEVTPTTAPFQSANPDTAAQLDSTYRPAMIAIELNTVIGVYRFGSLDSSASGPEFSQPMKPETASANVRSARPEKPPGEPLEAWNGAPRWPWT